MLFLAPSASRRSPRFGARHTAAFAAFAALHVVLLATPAARAQALDDPAAPPPDDARHAAIDAPPARPTASHELPTLDITASPAAAATAPRAPPAAPREIVAPADLDALRAVRTGTAAPARRALHLDPVLYAPRPPRSSAAGRRAARVTLSTLLALGLAAPGILPPLALTAATCYPANPPAASTSLCDSALVVVGAVGAALGALAGVHLVGHAMGGNARFAPTALGALLGGALGAVMFFAARNPGFSPAATLPALLLPVIGAVVTYEFDSRTWRSDPAGARPFGW